MGLQKSGVSCSLHILDWQRHWQLQIWHATSPVPILPIFALSIMMKIPKLTLSTTSKTFPRSFGPGFYVTTGNQAERPSSPRGSPRCYNKLPPLRGYLTQVRAEVLLVSIVCALCPHSLPYCMVSIDLRPPSSHGAVCCTGTFFWIHGLWALCKRFTLVPSRSTYSKLWYFLDWHILLDLVQCQVLHEPRVHLAQRLDLSII